MGCIVKFIFKRCFSSFLNLFAYSFVSSFMFGMFAMLIWFAFRFVGSEDSLLQFWTSQLSGVGLTGSVIGFCVGSLLTFIKKIKGVMGCCRKGHDAKEVS